LSAALPPAGVPGAITYVFRVRLVTDRSTDRGDPGEQVAEQFVAPWPRCCGVPPTAAALYLSIVR
jgi:hypothetical protein